MHPRLRTATALIGLVAVITMLHALSTFGLRGPDAIDRVSVERWLDDPIVVLATLARWIALLFAYYLAAVVVAVVAFGQSMTEGRLGRVVPPHVAGVIGLLLGTGAVAVPLGFHVAGSPTPQEPAASSTLVLHDLGTPPVLVEVFDDTTAADYRDPAALGARPIQSSASTAAEEWTVEPGESFWTIAEEHLGDRSGRGDLSEREIAGYWRTLIDANADRLVEPGNPDLLFPGQTLTLPEVPETPR